MMVIFSTKGKRTKSEVDNGKASHTSKLLLRVKRRAVDERTERSHRKRGHNTIAKVGKEVIAIACSISKKQPTKKTISVTLVTSRVRLSLVLFSDGARKVPTEVTIELHVLLDESIVRPTEHLLHGKVNDASSM